MKTIAVVNHKGGVGKTAVSMALAERLHTLGKKTLLIDLDQQINATLTSKVKRDGVPTMYDILLYPQQYKAKDAVQSYEHGDIIPGDILVGDAETSLSKFDTPLCVLQDALWDIRNDYEYCIIDCPPFLGYVTRNAMVAADSIIVVVVPDTASVDGFSKVAQVVEAIRGNRHLNPDLKIEGVLVNTYSPHGVLDRAIDEELPAIAKEIGTKVYETRIRKCIEVRKAQSKYQSIYDSAPYCTSAQDFEAFVDEFLKDKE